LIEQLVRIIQAVEFPEFKRNPGKVVLLAWLLPISVYAQISFTEIQTQPFDSPDDIVKYGEERLQFAEYWHPGTEKPALVVLIHGGCWLNEYGLDHVRSLASKLKGNNYAVWSMEYRRVGDSGGGWPGTFEDVIDSINHTGKLKNINQGSRFLLGHSAGGQLALWAGSAAYFPPASPLRDRLKVRLSGTIGLAAISDLEEYARGSSSCEIVTKQLMGGLPGEQQASYGYASPARLLPSVPAVLIHGESDGIVNISQSQHYATASAMVELNSLSDLGHFDMINPNGPAFDQILKALAALEMKNAEGTKAGDSNQKAKTRVSPK